MQIDLPHNYVGFENMDNVVFHSEATLFNRYVTLTDETNFEGDSRYFPVFVKNFGMFYHDFPEVPKEFCYAKELRSDIDIMVEQWNGNTIYSERGEVLFESIQVGEHLFTFKSKYHGYDSILKPGLFFFKQGGFRSFLMNLTKSPFNIDIRYFYLVMNTGQEFHKKKL